MVILSPGHLLTPDGQILTPYLIPLNIVFSLRFSFSFSIFSTLLLHLLLSHLFLHVSLPVSQSSPLFLLSFCFFPQFSLMDFLMFSIWEIKWLLSKKLEVVGMWWFSFIFFFSFHFNFSDSIQVSAFGFSYGLKRARSQVRGLWWCWKYCKLWWVSLFFFRVSLFSL